MPRFNRAYRGLYGSRMIQFGNKVSFAENKSRRTWKPNVQKTTLWSEILREKLPIRITTYAMRCIRKAGGLDQYLMRTKNTEIKYPKAIDMKHRIFMALCERNKTSTKTKSSGLGPTTPSLSSSSSPSRGLLDIL